MSSTPSLCAIALSPRCDGCASDCSVRLSPLQMRGRTAGMHRMTRAVIGGPEEREYKSVQPPTRFPESSSLSEPAPPAFKHLERPCRGHPWRGRGRERLCSCDTADRNGRQCCEVSLFFFAVSGIIVQLCVVYHHRTAEMQHCTLMAWGVRALAALG